MTQGATGWRRRAIVAAVFPAISAVGTALLWTTFASRLPTRVASHFGIDGRADGFTGIAEAPFVMAAVAALTAVVVGLLSWRMASNPQGQQAVSTVSGGLGMLLLVVTALTLAVNLDLPDPGSAELPAWFPAALIAALLAGGLAGWAATGTLPPARVPVPPGPEPTRQVDDHEELAWTRTVVSPVISTIAIIITVAALGMGLGGSWWMLSVFGPIVLTLGAFSRATVTVSIHGLTVRLLTGWPTFRVSAAEIESARSHSVAALREFGGWGWRMNRRASGIVLRSGQGLWVYRKGRVPLVVTVPDAEQAAALLNKIRDQQVLG